MTSQGVTVVLAGARGAAGKMHEMIHSSLGNAVITFDANAAPPSARELRGVSWEAAIMDICTPTAAHAQSLAWGYARGIRHFLVEKPAAHSLAEWRRLMTQMPDAQIFVLHPYAYSESFRVALAALPAATDIAITFDKDRESDDREGRGAGPDGRLPHLFQIEAPHQFAIALLTAPDLRVVSATVDRRGTRGREPDVPVSGEVTLRSPAGHGGAVRQARLTTSLRDRRQRTLKLRDNEGREALALFPTTSDLLGRVWLREPDGRTRLVFEGTDDLLRNTIVAATHSLQQGVVPQGGSASFAERVLACIDEAISLVSEPPSASSRQPLREPVIA